MPPPEKPRHLPLKRGTACVNCYQRRVRCNGQKPQCQQCIDYNFVCVYSEGKPPNKVKQLEEKVAQLTEMLRSFNSNVEPLARRDQQMVESTGLGSSTETIIPAPQQPNVLAEDHRNDTPMHPDGTAPLPALESPTSAFLNLMASEYPSSSGAAGDVDQPMVDDAEFLKFLTSLSSPEQSQGGSVSDGPPNQQDKHTGDDDPLPSISPTFNGSSTNFTSAEASTTMTLANGSFASPINNIPPQPRPGPSSRSSLSSAGPIDNAALRQLQQTSPVAVHDEREDWPDPSDPDAFTRGPVLINGKATFLDPDNVSPAIKDHLIQVFFSTTKMFAQAFYAPRFLYRVMLPEPKCPHPCLLYTMYFFACSQSPCPIIQSAEARFKKIAHIRLQESILKHDRILDAIRAATMLGINQQMQGNFLEGWLMNGQAARLAISCGLHQIPSQQFDRARFDSETAQRSTFSVIPTNGKWIPSPANAVELGEQIWAFWCTYTTDRCGAVLSQSPPVIPAELVTTPFPRPLCDYELGLTTDSTESISTLFSPVEQVKQSPREFDRSLLVDHGIKALTILARIVQLPNPSRGSSQPVSHSASPSSDHDIGSAQPGPADGVAVDIAEISRALHGLTSELPAPLRVDWEGSEVKEPNLLSKGSSLQADFISLFYVVGTSWLLLQGYTSLQESNIARLRIGSRLVLGMKKAMEDSDIMSVIDPFTFILWTIIARVLIGEAASSNRTMDRSLSARLKSDIEAALHSIKLKGVNSPHLKGQLDELDGMWLSLQSGSSSVLQG